MSIIIML